MTRVLVVDDHAIVRKGISQVVCDVVGEPPAGEASSVPEAVARLTAEDWDLVILDLTLPGGSGLDVLEQVRALARRPAVLVLSMLPEGPIAIRCLRAGAAGFLSKESAADELAQAIRKVLDGGRYVSSNLAEQLALEVARSDPRAPHERLTDREFQVMHLLVDGRTVSEIAAELALSAKTVSTYRTRLLDKLGVRNNVELARYALRAGLVDHPVV